MSSTVPDALRAPRLPSDDFETGQGSTHGDAGQIPRAVFRRLMEEEIAHVMGPVAERMRRDADRMEAAVLSCRSDMEQMRCVLKRVADHAEEMHESKRHLEFANSEIRVRLDRIERHLGLTDG